MRLLAFADAACDTGFATVSRNVLKRLHEQYGYEINTCAINYHGDPHPDGAFQLLWPASLGGDPLGKARVASLVRVVDPDVIWLFNDLQVIKGWLAEPALRGRPVVAYTPIDSLGTSRFLASALDREGLIPVTYTKFGAEELGRACPNLKVEVVPHGVDTKVFKPHPKGKDELRAELGIDEQDLIYLNVNRNQLRKNIPATMGAFRRIKDRLPDAKLHLHMIWDEQPPNGVGWNIFELIDQYGLAGRVMRTRMVDGEGKLIDALGSWLQGVPEHVLVQLYQASDVFVSSTMGEGWGLTLHESLACGTPAVATNCSSVTEIVRGRGLLADVDAWMTMHFGTRFAVVDEDDLAKKLLKLGRDKVLRAELGAAAVEWAKTTDWDPIATQWDSIFRAAKGMG